MRRRTRTAWLCVIFASLLGAAACGTAESSNPGAASGRIAFTVNRSGFGEIWVMDSEGGNRSRLTAAGEAPTDAAGSTSPAWSPDGERIAFASTGEAQGEDQDRFEIYVMRADGEEMRRLTEDDVYDATPTWAPDGTRIAHAHMPGFGTEQGDGVIVVMDTSGEGRIQLTRHPEGPEIVLDSHPAWSPDGTVIAFSRATFTEGGARTALYTIDPDGQGERLLIEDAVDPAWSPDGRFIAFTSIRDRNGETCFHECSPSGEIYVARSDGTGLRRLTNDQADDHSPTWAPDGAHIAFVSDRSNRNEHENEIYVMAAAGGGVRRLTSTAVWDLEPDWHS